MIRNEPTVSLQLPSRFLFCPHTSERHIVGNESGSFEEFVHQIMRIIRMTSDSSWLQESHEVGNRKDAFGWKLQHAAASEDHAVHRLSLDAVVHHAIVAGRLRALNKLAPENYSITSLLVFAGDRKKSAEYYAKLAPFILDDTRKPGDKSTRFFAFVESGSQRIARSGIV